MKTHYETLYPEQRAKWTMVYPCIFGNRFIKTSKYNKMLTYMVDYGENGFGILDCVSKNYAEALKKREDFLLNNAGIYLSHGGKDIMTGMVHLQKRLLNKFLPEKRSQWLPR